MCSPNWTSPAGTGWPTLVADAEQVLITAAVPDDVPSTLVATTVSIADGRIAVPS